MTDVTTDDALGRALVDLGAHVRVPAHPLWTRVRADLDAAAAPAHWRPRLRLIVAIACALVLLVASTLAIAPARRAVADFFGIGSTGVVRVDRLPADDPSEADDLPRRTDLRALHADLARAGLGLPAAELVGTPVAWRVDPNAETVVAFADVVLGQRPEGRVPAVKRVPPTGRIESTTVGGAPALWVEGPHVRTVGGRDYHSRSALLWTVDGVELRLEGNLPRGVMRRVAESVTPVR
jgi:hypothetical protein